MNDGLIPRRYAKALYKYALDKGCDAEVYAQMKRLSAAFAAEPKLAAVMANPFVAEADKRSLLLAAALPAATAAAQPAPKAPAKNAKDSKGPKDNTPAQAPADTAEALERFITILAGNRRIDMMPAIALAYEDIYRAAHGIRRVTLTSAAPLDRATQERIRQAVTRKLAPGETMEFDTAVNPDLIGGFTVNIDNNRLDASVANELKQMRLNLLSN